MTNGRATMSCTVRANGTLTDCSIVSEEPPGAGFGEATLELARFFRMRPMTVDCVPVEGGTVCVPVVWRAPE